MPSLFDIDLEEVAQVVKRRAGKPEPTLLLDRSGFGIAMGHDQSAQARAMLARHLLPHRLANCVAKTDPPVGHRVGEKNSPPVFRHRDVAVAGPTALVGCRGSAQIDIRAAKRIWAHFSPPVEKVGLPRFESPLQGPVVGEAYIVRNSLVIIDRHFLPPYIRSQSK